MSDSEHILRMSESDDGSCEENSSTYAFRPASSSTPRRISRLPVLEESSNLAADSGDQSQSVSNTTSIERRLERIEKNQKTIMENQRMLIDSFANGCSKESPRRKREKLMIPASIKNAVRDGYNSAVENGMQWTFTSDVKGVVMKASSDINKDTTAFVESFVLGIYTETQSSVLKAAVQRYFQSQKERNYLQKNGKMEKHNNSMVKYQRKRRKLLNRQDALQKKTSWDEQKKKKVKKSLKIDYMSSETEMESEEETVYAIKALSWRSQEFTKVLSDLDTKHNVSRSKKSKRLEVKRRRTGLVSKRPKPSEVPPEDTWVFTTCN